MKDEIVPQGKWVFDQGVADVFEDMLNRSIPGIEDMRETINIIIKNVIPLGGSILDIGCSDGQQLSRLQALESPSMQLKLFGVDNSREMIQKAVERCGASVKFLHHDMCEGNPRFSNGPIRYDVILSILTLQFIPVELRPRILFYIKNSLRTGGRFIFVEKVMFSNSEAQDLITKVYHNIKVNNGYSQDQVKTKHISLRNVLVSKTIEDNTKMLYDAGFQSVTTFWQNTAFVGWVAS